LEDELSKKGVASGPTGIDGLLDFLMLLSEMDESQTESRWVKGELEGPFFSAASYEMVVRVGFEGCDGRRPVEK
jgi:hypothetical protein